VPGDVKPVGAWKPGESGNPRGRTSGVERIRQLLDPHREDLVKKAVALALTGDVTALRMCLDRVVPVPRAESAAVLIPALATAHTLTEKAEAVARAIGKGQLSPDTGATLLQAIAAACKVAEFDDLQRRVAELESRDLL
jgi:Family of unknown function (DUF5681)